MVLNELVYKVITKNFNSKEKGVPEGVWHKCPHCTAVLYRAELERNLEVCPKCRYHIRINARKRLAQFLDEGKHEELASNIVSIDRLRFKDSKNTKNVLAVHKKP